MATKSPIHHLIRTSPTRSLRPQPSTTLSSRCDCLCRSFSVTPLRSYPLGTTYPDDKPRWQSTPPAMRTPVRLRGPRGPGYEVNTSSEVLDEAYVRVLGPGGDKVLSEEIKWLAVTHKSFDQGSRGFFDRLTYLGKRITELQTSIALIQNGAEGDDIILDSGRRESKVHAALKGLSNLHLGRGHLLVSKGRMADLARRYKLLEVVRWTPKYLDRLEDSGVALVLAQTMYAIVGAVALQKGGEVASRMVRERILGPLGIIE